MCWNHLFFNIKQRGFYPPSHFKNSKKQSLAAWLLHAKLSLWYSKTAHFCVCCAFFPLYLNGATVINSLFCWHCSSWDCFTLLCILPLKFWGWFIHKPQPDHWNGFRSLISVFEASKGNSKTNENIFFCFLVLLFLNPICSCLHDWELRGSPFYLPFLTVC